MTGEQGLERFERHLLECGGVAEVRGPGAGFEKALTAAVGSGRLIRVRRGWYALPTVAPERLAAARIGGVITASTAARSIGLWTLRDGALHVAVPARSTRLRLPRGRRVCVHRVVGLQPDAPMPVLAAVLAQLACCQSLESAVATIDSALNKGLVTRSQLEQEFATLPRRARRVLDWVDAGADSGIESLTRVRLRRKGVRMRVQVFITGAGRVDLLVGELLVIECDGREFHDDPAAFARDRERDLELVRQGYVVVRLTYRHVVHEWDRIEPILLELVRQRRHRRSRGRVIDVG